MNFNSLEFLVFLGIVLVLYFVIPHKYRWILLLIASYYFYMSWNAALIFLIVGTTAVSYVAGRLIEGTEDKTQKKVWLIVTLVVCLGILFFFKYFEFFLNTFIDLLNLFTLDLDSVSLHILLPIGISFYTFQTLSYVIDVYRGTVKAEKHFGYYALFVCYFPQLVAGPIERPGDLLPQLKEEHKLNADDMEAGLRIALSGFFRKCVVADFLGIYVTNVFEQLSLANGIAVFLAGALFCIQIYCDFAGYSEIAMGVARMMGVRLTRNFDRPYLSRSYTEYFRRWHITLSRWFIDYLYIPLGGNQKGKVRRILNVFIVFTLCGLWHGANLTYVLWGAIAAVFISAERLYIKPLTKWLAKRNIDFDGKVCSVLRTICIWPFFVLSGLCFRASSVSQLFLALKQMFTCFGGFGEAFHVMGIDVFSGLQIAACLLCMILINEFGREEKTSELPILQRRSDEKYLSSVRWIKASCYIFLILLVAVAWLALLASDDASVFQYFQF